MKKYSIFESRNCNAKEMESIYGLVFAEMEMPAKQRELVMNGSMNLNPK